MTFNNFVQAIPVFAFLLVLGHWPGVPDDNRWPKTCVSNRQR
jgi:hypothetical protein